MSAYNTNSDIVALDGVSAPTCAKGFINSLNSYVRVRGASGQTGSVDTNVRILHDTNVESSGSDITYSSTLTNGSTFTINTDGVYLISYQDIRTTGGADYNVSIDSTSAANALTPAETFAFRTFIASDEQANVMGARFLTSGTVIRPVTNQTAGHGTSADRVAFLLTRLR